MSINKIDIIFKEKVETIVNSTQNSVIKNNLSSNFFLNK